MSSHHGSQKSYIVRHVIKTENQIRKNSSDLIRRRTDREQRLQAPWMPGPTSDLDRQRQEFLLECLLDPRVAGSGTFGILWTPRCLWAQGPNIGPFAHIFDRSVNGHWTVSVSRDIDGNGNTGWLFQRV